MDFMYRFSSLRGEVMRRATHVFAVLPAVVVLSLLLINQIIPEYVRYGLNIRPDQLALTVVFLLTISAAAIAQIYLSTGFKRRQDTDYLSEEADYSRYRLRREIETQLESVRAERIMAQQALNKFEEQLGSVDARRDIIDPEQREQLVADLTRSIREQASTELIQEIRQKIQDEVSEEYNVKFYSTMFDMSSNRIMNEISLLIRRSNLNLSLGVGTTIAGLLLLGYFIVWSKPAGSTLPPFMIHFIPRLSLVIFIQIFAFFFLRLYKATLAEIRYYQNEVTNIEHKRTAFLASYRNGQADALGRVIETLMVTERNSRLQAPETGKAPEHTQTDLGNATELLQRIAKLLPAKQ